MVRPLKTPADERDVFRALGHPIRRRFVVMLRERPRRFDELTAIAKRSDATVAAHLRTLRAAGLVNTRRVGRHIEYRLRLGAAQKCHRWLGQVLDAADDPAHAAA